MTSLDTKVSEGHIAYIFKSEERSVRKCIDYTLLLKGLGRGIDKSEPSDKDERWTRTHFNREDGGETYVIK